MFFCCIIPIPRLRVRRQVVRRRVYIRQQQADGSVVLIPHPQQQQQQQQVLPPVQNVKHNDCTKAQCCALFWIIILVFSIFTACMTIHNTWNYANVKEDICKCTQIDESSWEDDTTYSFQLPYYCSTDETTLNSQDISSSIEYTEDAGYPCYILQSDSGNCKAYMNVNNPFQFGIIIFTIAAVSVIISAVMLIYRYRLKVVSNNKINPVVHNNNNNVQLSVEKKKLTPMQNAKISMTNKGYFLGQNEWINGGNIASEQNEGIVFMSGIYNEWYMMTMRNTPKHTFTIDLNFENDFTLNGFGVDDIGQFVINGIYNINTLRIALTKQYNCSDKRALEIRLEYKLEEREFIGAWHVWYNKVGDKIDYNSTQKNWIQWGAYGFGLKNNQISQGEQIIDNVEGVDYIQLQE
eukprot:938262_1